MSVTPPFSPARSRSRAGGSTGGASRPPRRGRSRSRSRPGRSPRSTASTVTVATAAPRTTSAVRRVGPADVRPRRPPPGRTAGRPCARARTSGPTTMVLVAEHEGEVGMPRACQGAPAQPGARPCATTATTAGGRHPRRGRSRHRRPRGCPRAPRRRTDAAARSAPRRAAPPVDDDVREVAPPPIAHPPEVASRRCHPAATWAGRDGRPGPGRRTAPVPPRGPGPCEAWSRLRPCPGCG